MEVFKDLSVSCSICQQEIPVNAKTSHQQHHKAMKILKYDKGIEPLDVKSLLKRRKAILKKIFAKYEAIADDPNVNRRINRVDEAFDAARSKLIRGKSVYESLNPLIERVRVQDGGLCFTDKEIHDDVKSSPVWGKLPNCVASLGTSYAKNIKCRDVMDDRVTTHPHFLPAEKKKSEKSNLSFFVGLYHGYHGQQAAEMTQQHLHYFIKSEIDSAQALSNASFTSRVTSETVPRGLHEGKMMTLTDTPEPAVTNTVGSAVAASSSEAVLRGCHKGFKRMDDYLSWGINETSRVRWSGCSVATCILTDEREPNSVNTTEPDHSSDQAKAEVNLAAMIGRLYVANVGGVEAHMCHNNKPFALTQCHTTSNEVECKRIEHAGGKIVRNGNNILVNGVSSVTRGLGSHGDMRLRRCVINDPHMVTAKITGHTQYAVIATESVWSVFSVEEVFQIVEGTEKYLQSLTKENISKQTLSKEEAEFCDSETSRLLPRLSKIVESDEEELQDKIEEVVIVHPVEDDDDASEEDAYVHSFMMDDEALSAQGVDVPPVSHDTTATGFAYKNWLVAAISNRIVRAAIEAGATDNVSAVVILFRGYFHGRNQDYTFPL